MNDHTVRIYDDNMTLLWDSADYSDVASNNTELVPVVVGLQNWQTWSESSAKSNLPIITSANPIGQLNITNDETIYMWYR
ncbi:unnamed protein product, partial [Rotaria socialis]